MNITNTSDNQLTTPIEYQQSESSTTFSIILTLIKIILLLGIIFFILYEVNKQTNNSIVNFFNNLFKSNSSSTKSTTTTTSQPTTNWTSYITDGTNSFKKQFYNEPFLNQSSVDLIEPKKYKSYQPQPDESTSNIQNKKGINEYTSYDNAYTGKLY